MAQKRLSEVLTKCVFECVFFFLTISSWKFNRFYLVVRIKILGLRPYSYHYLCKVIFTCDNTLFSNSTLVRGRLLSVNQMEIRYTTVNIMLWKWSSLEDLGADLMWLLFEKKKHCHIIKRWQLHLFHLKKTKSECEEEVWLSLTLSTL